MKILVITIFLCLSMIYTTYGCEETVLWLDTIAPVSIRRISKRNNRVYLREWCGTRGESETPVVSFPMEDWEIIKKGVEELKVSK